MKSLSWELVPHKGIESGAVKIFFGMERAPLRSLLSEFIGLPKSFRSDEDDYEAEDGTWIRLRFGSDKLRDIEFLGGSLFFAGIQLHHGAHWDVLQKSLAAEGYSFRETEWLGDGFDFVGIGINIATHEQLGGDEGDDGVEWIIASGDWSC